jgi:DNA primase
VFLAGFPAVCCFGVSFTTEQLKRILSFEKVLLFLDPDKAGQEQASELFKRLIFGGVDALIVKNKTKKDPGEMTKMRIRNLLKPYFT